MRLSALMVMLFTACAATKAPVSPWRIALTSSGGLAGRGAGSYSIDSDGRISVTTMQGRTCSATATAAQLDRFNDLVAAAEPDRWSDRYVPEETCCDRFEYTMSVDRAGVQKQVVWIDDPLPMPADLQAIVDAMTSGPDSLRARSVETCG
jgi:hypothetical protein